MERLPTEDPIGQGESEYGSAPAVTRCGWCAGSRGRGVVSLGVLGSVAGVIALMHGRSRQTNSRMEDTISFNSVFAACSNQPHWYDIDGETCDHYLHKEYCTRDGHFGRGWNAGWGPLRDYANMGVDALAACCTCGGGIRGYTPTPSGPRPTLPPPTPAPPAGKCGQGFELSHQGWWQNVDLLQLPFGNIMNGHILNVDDCAIECKLIPGCVAFSVFANRNCWVYDKLGAQKLHAASVACTRIGLTTLSQIPTTTVASPSPQTLPTTTRSPQPTSSLSPSPTNAPFPSSLPTTTLSRLPTSSSVPSTTLVPAPSTSPSPPASPRILRVICPFLSVLLSEGKLAPGKDRYNATELEAASIAVGLDSRTSRGFAASSVLKCEATGRLLPVFSMDDWPGLEHATSTGISDCKTDFVKCGLPADCHAQLKQKPTFLDPNRFICKETQSCTVPNRAAFDAFWTACTSNRPNIGFMSNALGGSAWGCEGKVKGNEPINPCGGKGALDFTYALLIDVFGEADTGQTNPMLRGKSPKKLSYSSMRRLLIERKFPLGFKLPATSV